MVALGVTRWVTHHGDAPIDPIELVDLVATQRTELGVGDLALLLLCLLRLEDAPSERAGDVVRLLEARSADENRLADLPGMEIAWFAWAATVANARGACPAPLLERAWRAMKQRKSPASPLYRHLGGGWRALFPNFATEIYALLALTEAARYDAVAGAQRDACALADLLIELRMPDGAWPWLYHADRGDVVEAYELYSVHQDAMAPMALFALSEVTGDSSYAKAAVESYRWCFGHNELSHHFYDTGTTFAHRSIKRRGASHHAHLWANTGLSRLGRSAALDFGPKSINTTCRPYHLGWVLEAWSGREKLYELSQGTPS